MAFGSFDRGTGTPMAEINTTPLVDVMLVLLVVFIITTPLLTQQVRVDLPQAASSTAQPPARQIRLAIDARGQHYWDGQPVSRDELGPRFAAAVSREPNVELALQADKALRYDSVAQALATAQRSGISRIGFVTTVP